MVMAVGMRRDGKGYTVLSRALLNPFTSKCNLVKF
jgi:hypothetical protein